MAAQSSSRWKQRQQIHRPRLALFCIPRPTARQPDLNHGLAYRDGFIYASSDTTVFRWPFASGTRAPITASAETVVHSMNADGQGGAPLGHTTRTLVFDAQGRLYISIGSNGNVDSDSYRSRMRRFCL